MKHTFALLLIIPFTLEAGALFSRPSNPPLEITARVSFQELNTTESQSETHIFHWPNPEMTTTNEINQNDASRYILIFFLRRFSGNESTFSSSIITRNPDLGGRTSIDVNIPLDKNSAAKDYELDLQDTTGKNLTLTITTKVNQ